MDLTYSEMMLTALLGGVVLIAALLTFQIARGGGEGFALPRWSTEPALIVGIVKAAIAVGLAFGLDLSEGQQIAILGLAAVLVGGSVLTRSRVTPVK